MGWLNAMKLWGLSALAVVGLSLGSALAQPDKPAETKPAGTEVASPAKTGEKSVASTISLQGRPARVVVLNFGAPSDWQGKIEDTVGIEINARAWKEALEILKKENEQKKIDVVVVRINSGGGYLLEVERFHRVFEEYMRNFRTVMWIESAISAAIMSPWVIPEIYCLPQGNFGGATAWGGAGVAVKGIEMETVHMQGEEASRRSGRDPKIMRSMQVEDALSATKDENGNWTFFQNESGKRLVKPQGKVLTLTADEGMELGLVKGKAATLDELMKLMGYSEWEQAGQRATKLVDDNMREMDRANKSVNEILNKYMICVQGARQLQDDRRRAEVGRARQFLKQILAWKAKNDLIGPDWQWFEQQEKILKDLLR